MKPVPNTEGPFRRNVLKSLFFETDILCWRHVKIIKELAISYQQGFWKLPKHWAWVQALAGWQHHTSRTVKKYERNR